MLAGLSISQQAIRVLGALMEKEVTTPDLYPLSLNALQSATNQRSSRDPVLDLSEDDLRSALAELESLGLAAPARPGLNAASSRVSRFEQHARSVLHLRRDEFAVLCLLLLRGPQTSGEIRSRADRLYSFPDLEAVNATLQRLMSSTEGVNLRPLVQQLPRQPGTREIRFQHGLGVEEPPAAESRVSLSPDATPSSTSLADLVHQLASRVASLESRLAHLEGASTPSQSELQSQPHSPELLP